MASKQTKTSGRGSRHCGGGRADERGSAIVLVLVSVVLLALLAATLLQVTRFERIRQPVSNIDIVVESVIAEILNQATADVLDEDGNMFNYFVADPTNSNGGGDEPWDFPWTNPQDYGRKVERIDGKEENVLGGVFDDMWLASSAPDFRNSGDIGTRKTVNVGFDPNNGVWRKITCLTGMFLGGTNASADLTNIPDSQTVPNEYPVNNPNLVFNRDTNLFIANPGDKNSILVDADNDGIGDSRWEWAPLRQIGTTRYVMAVRVIDLSGRVDLNVHMGRPGSADSAALRGDSPVELDGHEFVAQAALSSGVTTPATAKEEWRKLINYRMNGNWPPSGADPVAAGQAAFYDQDQIDPGFPSRRHFWENGAALVDPSFVRNGKTGGLYDYSNTSAIRNNDAFELLQNNGLNSSNQTTLEQIMPNLLRDGAGQEVNFVASTNGRVTGRNWTMKQFWEEDIRKQLTAYSGSNSVMRPSRRNEKMQPKLDVNVAVKTQAGMIKLSNTIRSLIDSGNGAALLARYPHLNTSSDLANQLTANIADYIDRDNKPTLFVNGGKPYIGFEALPYITEVYTQRLYTVTNVAPPQAPATTDTVTWTAAATLPTGNANEDQGYVIEIANPFAQYIGGQWKGRSISLKGVWLKLYPGDTAEELSALAGQDELKPGELLLLYRNSSGNTKNASWDDLSQYHTTTGSGRYRAQDIIVKEGPEFPVGRRYLKASLSAELDGTSNQGVPYSACLAEVSPQGQFTEQAAAGRFMPGYQGYVQTSYQGVGQGLRMMTVTAVPKSQNNRGFGDDVTTLGKPAANCDTGGGGAAQRSIKAALANEDKPNQPTGFASLNGNTQQIVWQDSPRERMQWIGDILQIPLIGQAPDDTADRSLMAEAFANAGMQNNTKGISALFLPFESSLLNTTDGGAPVNFTSATPNRAGNYGVLQVPHAVLLLEQLTTFSPAMDGEDGDGERDSATEDVNTPDEDELLVPGKINLNTASQQTLERVLPYPDLRTRRAVARMIIERRESVEELSTRGVGIDQMPGIMYTTTLYEDLLRLPNGFAPGYTNAAKDGVDTAALAARIDWNNYETAPGQYEALEDGIIDDREEQIMLGKWLTEVADTRSDVFAAYIVVQGYPAENFKAGSLESARLIIIFSRANVKEAGDRAVEIGRFRFK